MAITIEVSRGRYIRHLRETQRKTLRDATDGMNALLPSTERVTHAWLFQVEKDNPKMKMSALKALALHQVLGADAALLGVPNDDFAALAQLTSNADDLPALSNNRGRDRPKRSSSCIAYPVQARPSLPLVCRISNAPLVAGGRRADRA